MTRLASFLIFFLISFASLQAQTNRKINILAYYFGGPDKVDSLPAEKLTHIIYSFCHLKGNRLAIDNGRDSLTITKIVGLKKRNPKLKVILSLGGWGGCKTCSDMFSTDPARREFANSVLSLNQSMHTDGIDLDWEYPAIEGYPGHAYKPEDKANFTALVKTLREVFGSSYELSFAAGGFNKFLEESIDWGEVMKQVDRVNIMTYDLVNGYSTSTGHHTPLYSGPQTKESTDHAVQSLIKMGVPREKLVIGAAFYARVWENVESVQHGLFQQGKFKTGVNFKDFTSRLAGMQFYWDDVCKAPYGYDPVKKLFATFDDRKSIELKTKYAMDQHLDGIMFWEISADTWKDGLVDVMYRVKSGK